MIKIIEHHLNIYKVSQIYYFASIYIYYNTNLKLYLNNLKKKRKLKYKKSKFKFELQTVCIKLKSKTSMPNYGDNKYWDKRYTEQSNVTFDW